MRRASLVLAAASLVACFGSLNPDRSPTDVGLPTLPPAPPPSAPLPPASPNVASVTVTGPTSLRVGGQAQLGIILRDSAGMVIQAPYRAFWSSHNPGVVSISDGGLMQANAPGSATIVVTGMPVLGTKSVSVSP